MDTNAFEQEMYDLLRQPIAADPSYGTASYGNGCTSTVEPSVLTHATINEIRAKMAAAIPVMEHMKRNYADIAARSERAMSDVIHRGIAVQTSHMATTTEPNKVHKRRRGQTKAYHARIQKKWNKRFGTQQVPGAYLIDGRAIGLFGVDFGKTLVVHPSLTAKLRRAGL